jgi:hypothetical protein
VRCGKPAFNAAIPVGVGGENDDALIAALPMFHLFYHVISFALAVLRYGALGKMAPGIEDDGGRRVRPAPPRTSTSIVTNCLPTRPDGRGMAVVALRLRGSRRISKSGRFSGPWSVCVVRCRRNIVMRARRGPPRLLDKAHPISAQRSSSSTRVRSAAEQ